MKEEEYRREIHELKEKIGKLEKENSELEEMVQWMHDLVWEILEKQWKMKRSAREC